MAQAKRRKMVFLVRILAWPFLGGICYYNFMLVICNQNNGV